MEDFMNGLIQTARGLRNKGKTHIFLGDPLSDGCDKTAVEPGNGFSPGVWTCGITAWIAIDGQFYTPDLLEDKDISWSFGRNGVPPIVESCWPAGGKVHVESKLAHLGGEGAEGADFCQIRLSSEQSASGEFCIVLRDTGPAGGKIDTLQWDKNTHTLMVNNTLRLSAEQRPAECAILEADDRSDSPMAVLRYPFCLDKGSLFSVSFRAEHGFANRQFGKELPLLRPHQGISVAQGFEYSKAQWKEAVPARIFSPDERLERVWQQECFHILSAMECGLPRIGAVNYPLFWLRDGVIVLRALDLMGRHDLARMGNEALSTLLFSGGFGAEADAPGEGIWALVSHARLTKDLPWLKRVFPLIERRVEIIESMTAAEKPIRLVGENRIPFYIDTPGINLLCYPAVNGTIHGRMDWHTPDFFINCWAQCGLRLASEAARILAREDEAGRWAALAQKLDEAMKTELLPRYGNERDPIITPYPTGALLSSLDDVREKFGEWYAENRLNPDGSRNPEPLWTYFEAAQIHNAILLGFREEAWTSLDGMLAPRGTFDVSAYPEGCAGGGEALPFGNGGVVRGWLDAQRAEAGNMPHNWTSAELVNLLRDMFVREECGCLVLGTGVPKNWLVAGARFGAENMPTDFGLVSYTATVGVQGRVELDYRGPENYRLDLDHTENMKRRGT